MSKSSIFVIIIFWLLCNAASSRIAKLEIFDQQGQYYSDNTFPNGTVQALDYFSTVSISRSRNITFSSLNFVHFWHPIAILDSAQITFVNCKFFEIVAEPAPVSVTNSSVQFVNCTFDKNHVRFVDSIGHTAMRATNLVFINNSPVPTSIMTKQAGAVLVTQGSHASFYNCTLLYNNGGEGGASTDL